MRLKQLFLALAGLIAMAIGSPSVASTPSNVKYYENGKRIPTPAQVPPIYPTKEFKRRIGGTAIIAFSYRSDGKVLSASVKSSSGNKNLDSAALAAVKQWTLAPTVKDGQPVAGESESPVTFTP